MPFTNAHPGNMKKLPALFIAVVLFSQLNAQTPLKFRDTAIKGPQTFAIIVGVSKYKYVKPLNYADKDAEMFRDFLRSPGGGNVKEENIFALLNENALHSTFWTKGFQWLRAKQLQRGDRLFIYLAGHGDAIDEDQYFFLSYDCNPAGDKNNYLVGGAIQLYNLKKKIVNETSKGVDVFFVMDACRSNELPGGQEGLNFLNTAISEKKAGEIMMLATGAGQESLEDATIGTGHGLFTWYLVDGLSGLADTEGRADNKITFAEVKSYVDKNVPAVALQRFKRKQDPFFCCKENDNKVVSVVDAAYLQKWMQQKKRRGGNSIEGFTENDFKKFAADTALVETYNRFNRAIKNNNLSGASSAEDYYQQLEKKFPNNPYTMDAKTTLASEFVNDAQKRVNDYLACGLVSSSVEKQQNAAAGGRLEKAIDLLGKDEPEFAAALRGRMYLLKATGDYGTTTDAFYFAHAARSIDPDGAYILNWLSRLHLENSRADSAIYYADKAAKAAPKWPCALTTLALAKLALDNKKPDEPKKDVKKNTPLRKSSIGFTLGGGLNQSDPTYSGNANTGFTAVNAASAPGFNAGAVFNVNFGNTIGIRPAVTVAVENTDIDYTRRRGTGGSDSIETVAVKGTSVNVSLPLIIRFSSGNVAPYLTLGPSFSYMFSQNSSSAEILPVKKSLAIAGGGLGVDIGIPKAGIIIAPELKYMAGLSDMKDNAATTPASAALSSLKKNTFSLSVSLRKR